MARRQRGQVVGLTLVLAIPVVVALVALHSPRWFPLIDMAQIEMRVRDVPTTHPPLVGLGGRMQGYDQTGSHPGPLGFYLLWPVYRLLGSSAWALQVSSATLSLAAAGLAVWIARRRTGTTFAVVVAAGLAPLLRGYGAVMVTEPWNPRLPVVWWVVFLLAVWSVLDRDVRMLPLVVLAGTVCMQTHIPYAVLVGGLWALTVAAVAHQARRDREARRWAIGSGVLLVALWLPPLYEQLTHHPGNLAIIVENFRHPYDDQVPFGDAVDTWLQHLDVTALVRGDVLRHGSPAGGIAFLAVWAAAAAWAWRRRESTLLSLHVVAGAATVLGLLAISRIFGPLWPYLVFWAWGTTAVALVAIVWTFVTPWPRPVLAGATAVLVVTTAAFTVEAPDTEMAAAGRSDELSVLAGPTVERLEDDPVGCGDDCTYLVTWIDPVELESVGHGLLLELERQGFDARAAYDEDLAVRPHRTARRSQVDAEVQIVSGDPAITELRVRDHAELVAVVDPRTPGERTEYRRLRRALLADLEAHDRHGLALRVAEQVIVETDPRMTAGARSLAWYANRFPRPSAVFLITPEEPRP